MSESVGKIDYNADAKDVMWRALGDSFPADSDVLSSGSPKYWIPIPSAALREASSVADLGPWYAIGEAWSHIAFHICRRPDPKILDVGCGAGKMARFFVMTPGATYVGIDIFRPAIQWCQDAFSPMRSFSFVHFDIYSALYNGSGTLDVATTPLPTSEQFDLIICGSLFTHLLEPAFKHYLSELRRCLTPIGRAVVSTHNQPSNGRFSGAETRIDIGDGYFAELVLNAGMRVAEKVGTVFGQELYVLELA